MLQRRDAVGRSGDAVRERQRPVDARLQPGERSAPARDRKPAQRQLLAQAHLRKQPLHRRHQARLVGERTLERRIGRGRERLEIERGVRHARHRLGDVGYSVRAIGRSGMTGRAADVQHIHAQRRHGAGQRADREAERRALHRDSRGKPGQCLGIKESEPFERALDQRPCRGRALRLVQREARGEHRPRQRRSLERIEVDCAEVAVAEQRRAALLRGCAAGLPGEQTRRSRRPDGRKIMPRQAGQNAKRDKGANPDPCLPADAHPGLQFDRRHSVPERLARG